MGPTRNIKHRPVVLTDAYALATNCYTVDACTMTQQQDIMNTDIECAVRRSNRRVRVLHHIPILVLGTTVVALFVAGRLWAAAGSASLFAAALQNPRVMVSYMQCKDR